MARCKNQVLFSYLKLKFISRYSQSRTCIWLGLTPGTRTYSVQTVTRLSVPSVGWSASLQHKGAESREMWKKSGAWFFKGMPKQEKKEELPSPNLGEGHKKERRFTVYKPAWTEKDELTEAEVEESSEDEATGELAKRGLSKLGDSHSESDLSGPLSVVRCVQNLIRK